MRSMDPVSRQKRVRTHNSAFNLMEVWSPHMGPNVKSARYWGFILSSPVIYLIQVGLSVRTVIVQATQR